MMVRHEDVTQRGQRHIGQDKLASRAVATVDEVGGAVADETWADAELAFLGGGPPPLPRRISLVLGVWPWILDNCVNAPINVAVPARNARRLPLGM